MNVLSLFDGISCGQVALNKAKIHYDNYFASEIDMHAIKVTQHHYPNTIQLGDVTQISGDELPPIDLLMGGSPCQGFSYSGTGLNFNHPQSKLFFDFVRLLEKLKPRYFFLENVKMPKRFQDIITSYLGVEPRAINSNYVSAQSRLRYYWTNLPTFSLSKKEVVLADILEPDGSHLDSLKIKNDVRFIAHKSKASQNGLIYLGGVVTPNSSLRLKDGKYLSRNFREGYRVYSPQGKSVTLNAQGGGLGGKTGLYLIEGKIRRLSPLECERLQTLPDYYTSVVSKTQRYRQLGNGWTVEVIKQIFSQGL